jgi:ABC-2 type transport system ATP-binding protein
LSVEEVLWGATVTRGLTRREGVSALEWALERCQLIELSDRRCSTLSRGQRQRTRLASVLVHRPKLLVLDEVHSGLDPLQTVELNQLLSELARDCLVLLSTHRLSAAEEIADAYWVLHRGRLLAAGPISAWSALKGHHPDLTSEPLLTTVNGGSLEHAYLSLIAQDQVV